jgi:hypothetical protein
MHKENNIKIKNIEIYKNLFKFKSPIMKLIFFFCLIH